MNWTESQLKQHTQKQSIKAIEKNKRLKTPLGQPKSAQTYYKVESVIKITDGVIRLPIEPMGAVRLSSSDRWSKRPRAQKYFDWKNRFKTIISNSAALKSLISRIEYSGRIHIETVHPLPESWSKKKKEEHYGAPMRAKPDADNVLKAICDVIFKEDKQIHFAIISQRWCKENEQPTIIINS